jgi:type IV pilus assembly protein PilB
MGVEPFLIASTVRVIVGQRLVRRLCVKCRVSYEPDAATLKQLDKSFKLSEHGGIKHLSELEASAINDGIGVSDTNKDSESNKAGTSGSEIKRLWKASDEGCDNCNHSGYKGRVGIYEVLNNSASIQKMIVGNSTSEDIEKAAVDEGMTTMQLDGFIKCLRGQTTIEEVLRVTAEE